MRRAKLLLIPVALLMSGAALADDAAAVKKQIEASLNGTMKAFTKGDIKGTVAPLAADYKGTGSMGEPLTKDGVEAQMKMYKQMTKKVNSAKYTVGEVKVKGDKAIAKANLKLDSQVTMMDPKKVQRLQLEENLETTWAKRKGKWLLIADKHTSPPKMIVDGKPFDPTAPPKPQ
jgi:hypothetical protein